MQKGPAEMYLFDTDVITNILKKKPAMSLLERLDAVPLRHQYISTITVSEIVYGAMKSDRSEFHLQNLERILLPVVNIVGFDTKAAYVCGRLRADLEKLGTPLDLADLEIAAIAMAGDFTLVTGNIRYFDRVEGLRIENWFV